MRFLPILIALLLITQSSWAEGEYIKNPIFEDKELVQRLMYMDDPHVDGWRTETGELEKRLEVLNEKNIVNNPRTPTPNSDSVGE